MGRRVVKVWEDLLKRYPGDPATTNAVQTVPVYGNNLGEPCFSSAGFPQSWCRQGYRWNLDYVVDPRGNSMTYFYTRYSGFVGLDLNTNVQPYDLSGDLDHIDYGTRAGSEGAGPAPATVVFGKTIRCIGGCSNAESPDIPWDLYCGSATSCPNTLAPVFFERYKLSTVVTRVWNPATALYRDADQWDMAYTYPPSGDWIPPAGNDTGPNLWLDFITHHGLSTAGAVSEAAALIAEHDEVFAK